MPRVVISASRRTDIPAFYMPWFMDCIDQGLFKVINPYNRRIAYIPATPDAIHTIVFWSKNFGPFLHRKDGETLINRGYHLFFNFTINSPHPILEPNLPPLETRLKQLDQLAIIFGPHSIQWRFDPICFFKTAVCDQKNNLDRFETIARHAAKAGVRTCITSFVDLYRKVVRRLKNNTCLELIDPPMATKVSTITKLSSQLTALEIDLQLCCEKEVLAALPNNRIASASSCIPNDRLMTLHGPEVSLARDFGQRTRAGCQCRISKDIGSYAHHPCSHNCLFCYANPHRKVI
jgi:hypothetical protein